MIAPVLSLTTAGAVGAAVITEGGVFASQSDKPALAAALPAVMDALHRAGISLERVQLIAVCTGPGSFTGLRLDVALAKSIAQARGLPLVGVSSYDVAAGSVDEEPSFPRVAMVQGKRGFFYARMERAAAARPMFFAGSPKEIEDRWPGVPSHDLQALSPSEQAVRVARLAQRSFSPHMAAGWQDVQIDYGQRSNAEINWEARADRERRGGGATAAKLNSR